MKISVKLILIRRRKIKMGLLRKQSIVSLQRNRERIRLQIVRKPSMKPVMSNFAFSTLAD